MKDVTSEINLIALLPLILELLGLALVTLIDPYLEKKQRVRLLLNAVLIASLIAENIVSDHLIVHGDVPPARTILAIYGYTVRPLVLLLFCSIVAPDKKHAIAWVLFGVNAAVNATALFSGICFWIENNRYHRGPLGYCCHIVSAVILLYILYLTFTAQEKKDRIRLIIPIFNVVLVFGAAVMDTFVAHTQSGITFLSIAMVTSALFFYIWLHLKFVHDHERALEAENRIRIMMSRIQPHFLFNTLSSIQALCRIDPERAFDLLDLAARAGDIEAAYRLGVAYRDGVGVGTDDSGAFYWFKAAALADHPGGMREAGAALISGRGCPVNVELGQELLRRAAAAGDRAATQLLESNRSYR